MPWPDARRFQPRCMIRRHWLYHPRRRICDGLRRIPTVSTSFASVADGVSLLARQIASPASRFCCRDGAESLSAPRGIGSVSLRQLPIDYAIASMIIAHGRAAHGAVEFHRAMAERRARREAYRFTAPARRYTHDAASGGRPDARSTGLPTMIVHDFTAVSRRRVATSSFRRRDSPAPRREHIEGRSYRSRASPGS